MAAGADVKSLESVYEFRAAVLNFQEEARLCLQALESQILKFLGWIERERPTFWKRQIELSYREHGEARVSFHRCRMRKMGDFKPTCFEERKAMEAAKQALEFAQKQVPVVKYWIANTHHEANEYKGRSSQLHQFIERELPELLAILGHSIQQLEAYANVAAPNAVTGQTAEIRMAADPDSAPNPTADPESEPETDDQIPMSEVANIEPTVPDEDSKLQGDNETSAGDQR